MGGFTKAGLARLHDVLGSYVERGEVPALVALVSRGGHTHVEAIGTARDTVFRIASMSKPVTAVATMLLVEECRLRLDDPVDELLPELAGRRVLRSPDAALDDTVPARRPITVRDLLTFTMGFGQLMAPPDAYPVLAAAGAQRVGMGPPDPDGTPAPDEWIRRLGGLPLMYQPGERWLYNTGSDVLSLLVARAGGQPFDAFLRDRLFGPLGMPDTGFSVPAGAVDRFATGYRVQGDRLVVSDEPATGKWSRPPAFPSGAGGLVSTVDDYLAFARMLLAGGAGVLSRPAVALVTSDQLTPAQKAVSGFVPGYFDDRGWGFGVTVVTRRTGLASVGQYGWDGGLGSSWRNDPAEGLVGILLTQREWTEPAPPPVCRDFWTAAYAAVD